MLLGGMAMYAYIIMYCNNAEETVCCLANMHLKDAFGHLQTEWHTQEMVPAMTAIECGEVERFLIVL